MKLPPKFLLAVTSLLVGTLLGIWLQHRWPLGRLRDQLLNPPASPTVQVVDLSKVPPTRRLVIVAAGQSNAANYVDTRAAAGAGVYAFHEKQLFTATDPLPGGDGIGGSIWTRLGAQLVLSGGYDAVVLAVTAEGSTSVHDWAPGGPQHQRLLGVLHDLQQVGLPPDFILWQQGETEGRRPDTSGQEYLETLRALRTSCQTLSPSSIFVAAQATRHADDIMNEQVRLAQRAAEISESALPGPDMDRLGPEFRSDGVHFNARGAAAAAELWLAALRPALEQRAEDQGSQ